MLASLEVTSSSKIGGIGSPIYSAEANVECSPILADHHVKHLVVTAAGAMGGATDLGLDSLEV